MPNQRIIHVLWQGRAPCGQHGIPRDWPEDHCWVVVTQWELANCTGCRAVAPVIVEQQERRASI